MSTIDAGDGQQTGAEAGPERDAQQAAARDLLRLDPLDGDCGAAGGLRGQHVSAHGHAACGRRRPQIGGPSAAAALPAPAAISRFRIGWPRRRAEPAPAAARRPARRTPSRRSGRRRCRRCRGRGRRASSWARAPLLPLRARAQPSGGGPATSRASRTQPRRAMSTTAAAGVRERAGDGLDEVDDDHRQRQAKDRRPHAQAPHRRAVLLESQIAILASTSAALRSSRRCVARPTAHQLLAGASERRTDDCHHPVDDDEAAEDGRASRRGGC